MRRLRHDRPVSLLPRFLLASTRPLDSCAGQLVARRKISRAGVERSESIPRRAEIAARHARSPACLRDEALASGAPGGRTRRRRVGRGVVQVERWGRPAAHGIGGRVRAIVARHRRRIGDGPRVPGCVRRDGHVAAFSFGLPRRDRDDRERDARRTNGRRRVPTVHATRHGDSRGARLVPSREEGGGIDIVTRRRRKKLGFHSLLFASASASEPRIEGLSHRVSSSRVSPLSSSFAHPRPPPRLPRRRGFPFFTQATRWASSLSPRPRTARRWRARRWIRRSACGTRGRTRRRRS